MTPPDARAPTPSLYDRGVESVSGALPIDADPCMICGATQVLPIFRVDEVESPVVRCLTCGLGRFHPMLDAAEIRALYPEEYYGDEGTKFRLPIERVVRAVASRHISFISRGLEPGARILDVGCGRGLLFGPLADRGFSVHGVEMSRHAVQGCDPRADVRIAEHLADVGYDEQSFDQIVIWHVLEHLSDPDAVIAECRRILKPGGRLIVAVPNFASAQARWSGPYWFHLDPPRHLYHFPCDALRALVERAGFRVASTHHFSLRQNPFGWIQSALNRYSSQPTDGLYTLLHRGGARAGFALRTRLAMWFFLLATAPLAIALSVLAAWLRTGATIHITAIAGPGETAESPGTS